MFSLAVIYLLGPCLYLSDSVEIYDEYKTSLRGRNHFSFKQPVYECSDEEYSVSNTNLHSLVHIQKQYETLLESLQDFTVAVN